MELPLLRKNGFGVDILTSNGIVRPKYESGGLDVDLERNTEYQLRLINNNDTKADVSVYMEGADEPVGGWRVNPHSDIVVERGTRLAQKFLFVDENSVVGAMAGVQAGRYMNGIIRVVFLPEKEQYYFAAAPVSAVMFEMAAPTSGSSVMRRAAGSSSAGFAGSTSRAMTLSAPQSYGATIFGEESHQEFSRIDPIQNIDWSKRTEFVIRLRVKRPPPILFYPPMIPRPYVSVDRSRYMPSEYDYNDYYPVPIHTTNIPDRNPWTYYRGLCGRPRKLQRYRYGGTRSHYRGSGIHL